jgi:hypothetical protein
MQRLALAAIFAVLAVAAAAVAVRTVRAAWAAVDGPVQGGRSGGDVMQKLAFFLLLGLILYVSVLVGA